MASKKPFQPDRKRVQLTPVVGRGVSAEAQQQIPAGLFFFKQKTAYEMPKCLEFRLVLFRSQAGDWARWSSGRAGTRGFSGCWSWPDRKSVVEGKSGDLGGRRIIKKKRSRVIYLPISDQCEPLCGQDELCAE